MKMMKTLALAVAAVAAFTSCAEKNECKFNEKEYAERKTAHIDEIVDLTEEQEKEIYTIFEAQGLEIKENIKNMKCGECKPEECKKAECDKANCDKAECKKAECDKAGRHHHRHHHMVAPEKMKETFEKVNAVLTPEQQELLKAHHAGRRECAASMQACCPTPAAN